MDDEALQRAETMFLDAATDPVAWQAALDMVAQVTGSKGAAILSVEGHGPVILPTESVGELAERYVKEGRHQRDFRYAGVPQMKRTGFMVDQDFVDPERMSRMDYYADFLRSMGFGWFAGLRVTTGEDLWCLTLQRGVDSGAYLPEEQLRIARLGDVASRAAILARRLAFNRLEGSVDAADALDKHLAASIWPDLAADSTALRPVTVARLGKKPLIFHAIRLRGQALGFFSPACAMVTVRDLEVAPRSDMATFGRHYDLTPSEIRVARALVERHGLVDAAASLGISYETARTHAKMLYAKAATANQMELADLILRFGG